MATKVFLKWLGEGCKSLTTGREYEHIQDDFPYVVSNVGESLCTDGKQSCWQRIEREVFTAHGFEWFKHTPGDPMPCDGDALIFALFDDGSGHDFETESNSYKWNRGDDSDPIGWRYADSEQKEPVGIEWVSVPLSDGKVWPMGGLADATGAVQRIFMSGRGGGKSRCLKELGEIAEMQQRDLIAAVDDGHLTPGQKAYINAKEEKVAERLRSEAAKEELKKADQSKSIQDLANANGAVKFEHDHRYGARAYVGL